MDIQQIISLFIVAVAAALLVRRQIRKHKRAKLRPCGHDCGCSTTSAGFADKITYTLKKDQARR